MTSFEPFTYGVQPPRSGVAQQQSAPASAPAERRVSIMVPVSREIDLLDMAGTATPVPGTIYTRDFFLMHQTDAAIQKVQISSDAVAVQSPVMQLQLVAVEGQEEVEITGQRVYSVLPVETEVIEGTFPTFTGALFLRVTATSQEGRLFVTLDILSSKVS